MPTKELLAPCVPAVAEQTRMYEVDPVSDPRWTRFVQAQPNSSIFHTAGWLHALQHTYGYQPVAFVDAPPECEIETGQAFCLVDSWITGKRFVSVPFSDHAEILSADPRQVAAMLSALQAKVDERQCGYVELRPIRDWGLRLAGFCEAHEYYHHHIDLSADLSNIYAQFHKDCVQRNIRRAERERLAYSEGRNEEFVEQYYRLLLLTIERHHVPPKPISWFRNLASCLGEAMKIRIASKNGQPVAGIITLRYNNKIVYKYGASDARYHRLGGNAFLLWTSIQDAKDCRMLEFDLGRSDVHHAGLIAFKEHMGARRSRLTYWRYPARQTVDAWAIKSGGGLLRYAPKQLLTFAGKWLYKHMG